MEKQDCAVDTLPDGFHVTGFLSTVTGAKLKKVIDSISAPRDKDDTRSGRSAECRGWTTCCPAQVLNATRLPRSRLTPLVRRPTGCPGWGRAAGLDCPSRGRAVR
jgi:hypothetical protein